MVLALSLDGFVGWVGSKRVKDLIDCSTGRSLVPADMSRAIVHERVSCIVDDESQESIVSRGKQSSRRYKKRNAERTSPARLHSCLHFFIHATRDVALDVSCLRLGTWCSNVVGV